MGDLETWPEVGHVSSPEEADPELLVVVLLARREVRSTRQLFKDLAEDPGSDLQSSI